MSLIIVTATILLFILAGLFLLVFRKLLSEAALPVEDDWLQQLSPMRYRPMERLLDPGEYRRLEAHPAFTPKMRRQFRSQRVRIFREYLRCLSLDYNRVCKMIRLVIVQSSHDRSDLAQLLIRQRLTFTMRLVMAEFQLTLHVCGVGSVDTAKLVAALDGMRLELNSLVQAQPAAA
jgi:hypothetical protein